MQGRQVGLVDAETPAQCRDVQQVEDLAHGETAVGQFQQVLQGDQQRLATALSLVGQGIGNEALVVARHLAEHRLDVRCVGVDVGDHDDHVARLQARIGVEAGEQLVVEDLHFALRAVGHMEADRGVAPRRHRRPVLAGFRQWAQFEDIVLQLAEQPVRGLLAEQVDAPAVDLAEQVPIAVRVVVAVEQVDVVAALLAPGRQQRLGMLVLAVLVEVGGDAGAALLAAVLVAQQVLVGDDVGPVVATGVVHAEQHLAEPGQGGQRPRVCAGIEEIPNTTTRRGNARGAALAERSASMKRRCTPERLRARLSAPTPASSARHNSACQRSSAPSGRACPFAVRNWSRPWLQSSSQSPR